MLKLEWVGGSDGIEKYVPYAAMVPSDGERFEVEMEFRSVGWLLEGSNISGKVGACSIGNVSKCCDMHVAEALTK